MNQPNVRNPNNPSIKQAKEIATQTANRNLQALSAKPNGGNNVIEEIQGGIRNNKYGNSARTNRTRAMTTNNLNFHLGSRSINARTPPYIAEAIARLKNKNTSRNNKVKLVAKLHNTKRTYGISNIVVPEVSLN